MYRRERVREGKFNTMRSSEHTRYILKKYTGEHIPYDQLFLALPTKHWQKNLNHTKERPWIDFKCDVCGFVHTISKNHTINKDGNVEPSFGRVHVNQMCGIHEWIKLEGWEE